MASASTLLTMAQLAGQHGRASVFPAASRTIYMENRSGHALYIETYDMDGSADLGFILDPQEYRVLRSRDAAGVVARLDVTDLTITGGDSGLAVQPLALASLVPVSDLVTGQALFVTWSQHNFDLGGGARVIGQNVPPNYVQIVGPSSGFGSGTLYSDGPNGPQGFALLGPFTALKLVNANATTNLGFSLDNNPITYIGVGTTLELDNINARTIGYVTGGSACTIYAWQYAYRGS